MQIRATDLITVGQMLENVLQGTVPGTVLEIALKVSKMLMESDIGSGPGKTLQDAIKAYEKRTFEALDKV